MFLLLNGSRLGLSTTAQQFHILVSSATCWNSEKYQKRFGPLRYFVAGFLKFICLPKYSFDLEYLPMLVEISDDRRKAIEDRDKIDTSDLYIDTMQKSGREGLPKASSLSSIDLVMTPNKQSGDLDTTSSTLPSSEPSEFVGCIDPKSKRLSSARSNLVSEPEVIHPQLPLSATPNWPRTRSKSQTDKTWAGLNTTNNSRSSWATSAMNDREDISSTISDPGPFWDAERKWDAGPNWDVERNWETENPTQLPGPPEDRKRELGSLSQG